MNREDMKVKIGALWHMEYGDAMTARDEIMAEFDALTISAETARRTVKAWRVEIEGLRDAVECYRKQVSELKEVQP